METQKTEHGEELVCVYNAESGLFNMVFSSIHKTFSPDTYACDLCRLSHGLTGMLGAWKTYLEYLPMPVRSYYRDQFRESFPESGIDQLPVILLRDRDGGFHELVDAERMATAGNLVTLINLLDDALKRYAREE